jgi:hypothetical protein
MKKLLTALILCFALTTTAFAAEEYGNILKGNFTTGASLSFAGNGYSDTSTNWRFNFNLPFEYFVMDHLSVGIRTGFAYETDQNSFFSDFHNFDIGPSAHYYFYAKDRFAAYIGAAVLYNSVVTAYNLNSGLAQTSNSIWETDSQVGLNYFIVPAVAAGPTVGYSHYFRVPSNGLLRNQLYYTMFFSVYL